MAVLLDTRMTTTEELFGVDWDEYHVEFDLDPEGEFDYVWEYIEDRINDIKWEFKNLSKMYDFDTIIGLADLGFWDGRKQGYKILNNLEEIFSGNYEDIVIEITRNNLWVHYYHHDGVHHVQYREFKESTSDYSRDKVCEDIIAGKDVKSRLIGYTSSIGGHIRKDIIW